MLAAKRAEDHSVELARQWANANLIRFERKAKKIDQRLREQEMEKKRSGKNPLRLASLLPNICGLCPESRYASKAAWYLACRQQPQGRGGALGYSYRHNLSGDGCF